MQRSGDIHSLKVIGFLLILVSILAQGPSPFALARDPEVSREEAKSPTEKKEAPPPIDPDASPALSFEITPRFSMGAKLEMGILRRINRDLNDAKEDDRTDIESSLDLAAQLLLQTDILLFGEAHLSDQRLFRDGDGRISRETEVRLRRGYLLWNGFPFPSADLQLGRQRFSDAREWIYDENLDAVRVFFRKAPFDLELSVSTNLLDPEEPEDEIRNYILYATYLLGQKEKIALYGIARRDPTEEDRNPNFIGISWRGKAFQNQKYWLEIASLSGREGSMRLKGHGFDLGWTSRLDFPLEPSFTVGYAFGSGDPDPADRVDRNFQQTGLQDNQGKFNGITKFKYYGELFGPELSNIMIGTAGFGIIPFKKGSLDVVYHYYSQMERANVLRDVGIKQEPSGISRDLGHEVDLVFGMKIVSALRIEILTAAFIPGKAFPNSDRAFSGEFTMRFLF